MDQNDINALIEHMKDCGWKETITGAVTNARLGITLPSWVTAIRACIEIGSDV